MINGVGQWMAKTDLTELGNRVLGSVNDALGRIPYLDVSLSADGIRDWVSKAAQTVGSATLSVARESVGGSRGRSPRRSSSSTCSCRC